MQHGGFVFLVSAESASQRITECLHNTTQQTACGIFLAFQIYLHLEFSVQVCGLLQLAQELLQDVELGGAECEQQVADLPQQVLEGAEQLGEVRVVPVHVEGAVREDEEAADDSQPGNGEHEAETEETIYI